MQMSYIHQLQAGRMYSVFTHFADVSEDQGALDAWPGTHTHVQFFETFYLNKLPRGPAMRMALPQGSMIIYDTRLVHRGSANSSPRPRPNGLF